MTRRLPIRAIATVAVISATGLLLPAGVAQRRQGKGPQAEASQRHEGAGMRGEHLAQWLKQHDTLSPKQQQEALENEPGFHDLPAQTQQRMRRQLAQLDSMSPEQRNRMIQRTEEMERLTPDQRGEVRQAMTQLSVLPPERRRAVERTFRSMRLLNAQQQETYLHNPAVRGAFNDQEFAALNSLISVSPLLPRTSPAHPQEQEPAPGH